MSGVISLLLLHASVAWTGTVYTFSMHEIKRPTLPSKQLKVIFFYIVLKLDAAWSEILTT